MIKEAIILAGGLGTRLRTVVADVPKCLAPVAGKPFLYYVLKWLEKYRLQHIILSLGYKHEMITAWCNENKFPFELSFAIEEQPMGTGGAIKNALGHVREETTLILNGDTLFNVDIRAFHDFHLQHPGALSLCLKPMRQFNRYGAVKPDGKGRVLSFEEKKFYAEGLINGGVYLMGKKPFLQFPLPEKFSFENDYLVPFVKRELFFGYISDAYFIDIGVPADYERAQTEIKTII